MRRMALNWTLLRSQRMGFGASISHMARFDPDPREVPKVYLKSYVTKKECSQNEVLLR